MGAYIRTHGVVVPELTAALLPGPYRIPHYTAEVRCVLTNKTPTGTYRGPGRFEGTFVRERLMDVAAQRLGLDPLELRRRNLIPPDEMPYEVGGASLNQRIVYDCGDYASALDKALAALDYEAARREQAEARRQGRHVGIGVALPRREGRAGPVGVRAGRDRRDGPRRRVLRRGVGRTGDRDDARAGLRRRAGRRARAITVVHGDSARVPFGVGGFASRGAAVALPAALEAARKVRAKILASPPRCSRPPSTTSCSATARCTCAACRPRR